MLTVVAGIANIKGALASIRPNKGLTDEQYRYPYIQDNRGTLVTPVLN